MSNKFDKLKDKNIQDAIYATWDKSDGWSKDARLTGDFAIARDTFLYMVKNLPVDVFEEYKSHSFWKNWVSVKSKFDKNILHFATNTSNDIRWIDAFLKLGLYPDDNKNSPLLNAFSQPADKIVDILKIYEKNGIDLKVSDNDYKDTLSESVRVAHWPTIKYLLDKNIYPQRPNLNIAEEIIVNLRGVNLGDLQLGEYKKRAPAYLLMKEFWTYWGVPDGHSLRRLWSLSSRYHFSNEASNKSDNRYLTTNFIEKEWNPNHADWTKSDLIDYFVTLLNFKKVDTLIEKINDGWVIEDEDWKLIKNALNKTYGHNPPDLLILKSAYEKREITKKIQEENFSSLNRTGKKLKI